MQRLSVFAGLVGLVGLVVHAVLATMRTPILYNHYSALWACFSLLVASHELWLTVRAFASGSLSGVRRLLATLYFLLVTVLSLVFALAYAADSRFDVLVEGLLQTFVGLFGVYILVFKNRDSYLYGKQAQQLTREMEEAAGSVSPHAPPPPPPPLEKSKRIGPCAHFFLLLVHLALLAAIAAGGAVVAYAAVGSPPSGVETAFLVDGRLLRVNVHCVDPPADRTSGADKRPRLWLVPPPASGGVLESLGVQDAFAQAGWRSCAFDPLGIGRSQRLPAGMGETARYLPALITAVEGGGGGEVALVAWGSGGSAAVSVAAGGPEGNAARSPFALRAVALVEVFPPGVEWDEKAAQGGLDAEQRAEVRYAALRSQLRATQLTLALSSPLGFLPVLSPIGEPPAGFSPRERWQDLRAALWRPRRWVARYWRLRRLLVTPDAEDPLLQLRGAPMAAPIGATWCALPGDAVCHTPDGPLDDGACEAAKKSRAFRLGAQAAMNAGLGVNETEVDTTEQCDMALPAGSPERTAAAVIALVKKLV